MELHSCNLATITILDNNGAAAGELFYVPLDLGIATRGAVFTTTVERLAEQARPLHIRPDGTAVGEDAAELSKIEAEFFEALDRACGVLTAESAFKHYRPFALVGGNPWAVYVCKALSQIVKRVTKELYIAPRTLKQKMRNHV